MKGIEHRVVSWNAALVEGFVRQPHDLSDVFVVVRSTEKSSANGAVGVGAFDFDAPH